MKVLEAKVQNNICQIMKRSIITMMAAFGFVAMAQAEPVVLDEAMATGFVPSATSSVSMDCYNFNEPIGAPRKFGPRKKVLPPQPRPEARPVPPPPAPPEPPRPPKKKRPAPQPPVPQQAPHFERR